MCNAPIIVSISFYSDAIKVWPQRPLKWRNFFPPFFFWCTRLNPWKMRVHVGWKRKPLVFAFDGLDDSIVHMTLSFIFHALIFLFSSSSFRNIEKKKAYWSIQRGLLPFNGWIPPKGLIWQSPFFRPKGSHVYARWVRKWKCDAKDDFLVLALASFLTIQYIYTYI